LILEVDANKIDLPSNIPSTAWYRRRVYP